VQRALVQAADAREAVAQREVDRAGHLLVEEDVAEVARDALVAAEPELAEAARARVGVERGVQVVLALVRRRLDHLAAAQDEPHAGDLPRRQVEQDLALRGVLDRAEEDLAARDVHVAVVDRARAAGEAQREVCPVAGDPHLLGAVEALEDRLHVPALGVPVPQARVVEDVLVLREREPGLARKPRGREVAAHLAHEPGAAAGAIRRQLRAEPAARLDRELGVARRVLRREHEDRAVHPVDDLLLQRREHVELGRRLLRPRDVERVEAAERDPRERVGATARELARELLRERPRLGRRRDEHLRARLRVDRAAHEQAGVLAHARVGHGRRAYRLGA
jgi:hypothetical protein